MVLTVPDYGLASILLRIASKTTSGQQIATPRYNSIATNDSVSSAVDGFRAAQLSAYVDGTLDQSSPKIGKLALSLQNLSTMDSQTRKALVRKRAALKARMTHIKKYVDILPDTVDMHDVNVRLQLLEKVW
jgi:hypothetical protein